MLWFHVFTYSSLQLCEMRVLIQLNPTSQYNPVSVAHSIGAVVLVDQVRIAAHCHSTSMTSKLNIILSITQL